MGGGSKVEFGGDASPVEAGSSEVFFLDEGDRFCMVDVVFLTI